MSDLQAAKTDHLPVSLIERAILGKRAERNAKKRLTRIEAQAIARRKIVERRILEGWTPQEISLSNYPGTDRRLGSANLILSDITEVHATWVLADTDTIKRVSSARKETDMRQRQLLRKINMMIDRDDIKEHNKIKLMDILRQTIKDNYEVMSDLDPEQFIRDLIEQETVKDTDTLKNVKVTEVKS